MTNSSSSWLAYCRAGFERDLALEITAQQGINVQPANVVAESGFAIVPAYDKDRMHPDTLIFARQLIRIATEPILLGTRDRVTPLVAAAGKLLADVGIQNVGDVWLEYPDTNEGKTLSSLSRNVTPLIRNAMEAQHLLAATDEPHHRLHIFLTKDNLARVGLTHSESSSPWPLGIPRLRMPGDAPSRSTLKLLEAFHLFLGENEEQCLRPDMRAVDLGAAPGGWTWQLTHRGLRVTAVDNANLKGELVDNALVQHLREDGFRYQPKVPVDWLVCDMVEQPIRVAQLVAKWLGQGWARYAIFNLKLPMKKRLEEVARCRSAIETTMNESGKKFELKFKQLYHDREEITAFCRVLSRAEKNAGKKFYGRSTR